MFSHTKFQIGINIWRITFLQWVQIKPHPSSLTNIENSTSNFCQSVQICCREKGKEENNGNCKAFCVTHKCNKLSFSEDQWLVYLKPMFPSCGYDDKKMT